MDKKMRTNQRGYEVANNNHVYASKDIPQPKKLGNNKAARKSTDELKEPPLDHDDPNVAETLWKPARFLKESLHFQKSLPYLMLPPISPSKRNDDTRRQFYSLVEGESVIATLGFPAFKTRNKMYFESLGWLLTVDEDGSMSLLDPFSADTEIPLPHQHTFPGYEGYNGDKRFYITKMVLSSRPNETSDFILMVIIGDSDHLAFWRLGDQAWNKVNYKTSAFRDVVYGGGEQFYAIDCKGFLWVINIGAGNVECPMIVDCKRVLGIRDCNQYILKTIDGTLLGITRKRAGEMYLTNEFRVYDIDIETGKWNEIYSLGSMAIFLGRNSSFTMDTSNVGGGVIKANHIYFTDDYGRYQHNCDGSPSGGASRYAYGICVDNGVFNLETKHIEMIFPEPALRNVCPPIWIIPNLS